MYAYKHLPTQKWVNIVSYNTCQEYEIYGSNTVIELVDDLNDATTVTDLKFLDEEIKNSVFEKEKNYFQKHFIELQLINI
jgi:hypothetical protein